MRFQFIDWKIFFSGGKSLEVSVNSRFLENESFVLLIHICGNKSTIENLQTNRCHCLRLFIRGRLFVRRPVQFYWLRYEVGDNTGTRYWWVFPCFLLSGLRKHNECFSHDVKHSAASFRVSWKAACQTEIFRCSGLQSLKNPDVLDWSVHWNRLLSLLMGRWGSIGPAQ